MAPGLSTRGAFAAPSPRPSGSGGPGTRAPSADAPEASGGAAPEGRSTNVDELMDAVGASGVDIGAEEEGLRSANERLHAQQQASLQGGAAVDRSRKQDFIDQGVLAECVKKIAAAFQLRTLEPDTIPLIALATRHRLSSLIHDAIAARDHRRNSSHLRPPPFTVPPKKRRRKADGEQGDRGEEEEQSSEEEDAMDEFNFDVFGGGKGKGKEKVPAWDTLVLDDTEKLLGVLERVDREEERKKRRERMLREQKEQEERDLAEAIAASEAAEREAAEAAGAKGSAVDKLLVGGTPGGSGPSTPRAGGDDTPAQLDKNGKPKKPRKKKTDGPATSARNMSEDVKKRLTDQVAMRSLGGKNFSWLNAGLGGGMSSPSPAGLPKPKFAPASSLPPPTFNAPGPSGSLTNGSSSLNPDGTSSGNLPPALSRLSGVPPLHDANRAARTAEEWERGANVTELGDLLWVLERERGMGVGKGSGRDVLLRGRAGIIKRPL